MSQWLNFYITTGEDYTIMTESRPLVLSTEFPNTTIIVEIVDDDIIEPDESFEISLHFPQGQPFRRVTLDPNIAIITILGPLILKIGH